MEIAAQTSNPDYVIARILRTGGAKDALPPRSDTVNVVSLNRYRDHGEEVPPDVLVEAEDDADSEIEQRVKELIAEVSENHRTSADISLGETFVGWLKILAIIGGGFAVLLILAMLAGRLV